MKKLSAVLLAAAFGLSLTAAGPKPKKPVLDGGPLQVELTRDGHIVHRLNGRGMFHLMLQVHWLHFAYRSKDLRIAVQEPDVLRSAGSFANVRFSSRTRVRPGRAETEYQLHLTEDNAFAPNKQWEVTPCFKMDCMKTLEDCAYSGVCVDGGKFSGRLRDIVGFPGKVGSFTVHDVQGYDLTLEFPDGALGMDRRRETKPAGLWFFVPAVTRDGAYPQKAGERAVLRFNAEAKKIAEK